MNCDNISEIIGIQCEELVSSSGEPILSIETPFVLGNGAISIFVQQLESKIRFFDAGETFFELINCGIDLSDKRRWTPLKNILSAHGVSLRDSGEIELWTESHRSPEGFAMLSASLLAIAQWQLTFDATDDTQLLAGEL